MRVSIIGTGYVGLVSGTCLAEKGHIVTCVDIDEEKVRGINDGVPPIHEIGLEELLKKNSGVTLRATTNLREAVLGSDLTMIAVGTPYKGEEIDLSQIRSAATAIGEALKDKDTYHVVVVKSTVVPGTTDTVVLPLLEAASGKKAGEHFGVGMNPEFLAEGRAVEDFMDPDRIVIGAIDEASGDRIAELYAEFAGVDVVRTSTATAEMAKYTANALLATLISFSNEIGGICEQSGVDVVEVMRAVHLDRRLTPITAHGRVRPAVLDYVAVGCGYGGSCFPKDVRALVAFGKQRGERMDILQSVTGTNERQPHRVVDMIVDELDQHGRTLAGSRIAVLGVAFKPGTDDVRESPSDPVIRALLDGGATVIAHDPIAYLEIEGLQWEQSFDDAVAGSDVVVVMTTWPEYKALPEKLSRDNVIFVDARRYFPPSITSSYRGVGRARELTR